MDSPAGAWNYWKCFSKRLLRWWRDCNVSPCEKKLRELRLSSPGKAQGHLINTHKYLEGRVQRRKRQTQRPMTRQNVIGKNWNRGGSVWPSGRTSVLSRQWRTGIVAQKASGLSSFEELQKLPGRGPVHLLWAALLERGWARGHRGPF